MSGGNADLRLAPPAARMAAPVRRADRLSFETDGADWPNRAASRFVRTTVTWHVQEMGEGPDLLLLHGTGASTHSFAELAPRLAARFRVLLCDLPGHGFSERLPTRRMTLPGMAAAVGDLLAALGVRPAAAVGHSAGAAILIRMAIDGRIAPGVIVSLNGALVGFGGPVGRLFSPLAQLLAANAAVPAFLARRTGDETVFRGLVARTGSRLDDRQSGFYRRLAADPDHVGAALAMMAGWDLGALRRDFRRLTVPVVLVAGSRDGMVPAEQAFDVEGRLPRAESVILKGLGHLAHEEAPDRVAAVIEAAADRYGVFGETAP